MGDLEELRSEYPGYLVAYSDGKRIAMGRDARELLENVPDTCRDRPLFIKEVPEIEVAFRRPFRVLES